jgi:putative copper resistance protein D
VWAGGLVALALVRRLPAGALAKAVARFSGLALGCIAVVAVSGVISALVRVNSVADVFTRYGVLLAGKLLALLVLAGLGAWHRRAALPALAAGRPGRFVRVASVEIGVLAATFGLAAGLARTPPPSKLRIDELLEIPLRRAMEWLPDLVFLTLAVAAVAGYLIGLRRLRGHRWPVTRTAAWIAGWALVVLASDLQLARTGAGMFGLTDRLQHLTIGTAAPLLLAAGRGATVARLALRPTGEPGMRGPAEWLAALGESRVARAVRHPVGTVLLAAAGVYALYLGVQYSFALTTHAAHLAVLAGALVAGLLVAERLLDAGLREPVRLTLGAAVLALTALLVLVFTVSAALPSSLSDDPGRAVPPTMFTGQWLVVTALCVLAVWVACATTAPRGRRAAPEPRGLADTDVKDSSIPAQRADAQTPNMPRRSATGAESAP